MSIKIYEAYRTSAPLHAIREAFFAFRKPRLKVWGERVQAILGEQSSLEKDKTPAERVDAATEWAARFSYMIQTGNGIAFPELSAVLFPCHDGQKWTTDSVLLIYDRSNDRKETLKTLRRKLKLTDYGYWDNTDPDETLSEKDWALRKKAWGKMLLSGDGVPSKEGLVLEVIDKKDVHIGIWDAHTAVRNAKFPDEKPWESGWRSFFFASDLHDIKSSGDVTDTLVKLLVGKSSEGSPGNYTGTEEEFRKKSFSVG